MIVMLCYMVPVCYSFGCREMEDVVGRLDIERLLDFGVRRREQVKKHQCREQLREQ